MKTEYVKLSEESIDPEVIGRAGRILQEGGLVAFPTETVYGLGGDALNPESSRKIYAAKGRPSDNPLIVHICRMKDLRPLAAEIPDAALRLAAAFWPGPLTMIFKKTDLVPMETTGGLSTVAVRFPSNKIAAALIDQAGGFVAAPSANRSGRPSTTTADHCREDLDGRVDMIIDGGPVDIGLESTIIDLTEEQPVILRPGRITRAMLEEVLGRVEVDRTILSGDSSIAPKAPGMKYRHYAPQGSLTIVEGEREGVIEYINRRCDECRRLGIRTGVLCTDETRDAYRADAVKSAGSRKDEDAVGRVLFRLLREFDTEEITIMFSESFEDAAAGQAIMNRLMKAAGHQIVHLPKASSPESDVYK